LALKNGEPRTPPPAVIEAQDAEPADSPNTPMGSSNKLGILLTVSGMALVATWLALRTKRMRQS
jgi:hypothetical protein